MRKIALTVMVASSMVVGGTVVAQASMKSRANHSWHVCWKENNCDPGRNIAKWGVKSKHGLRSASKRELKRFYNTLRRNITWARSPHSVPTSAGPNVAYGRGSTATAAPVSSGSSNSYVNPNCESGGRTQVYDPSGTYWGKYQFDKQTWVAHGGSPSAYGNAPESVQDQVAANVNYDAWPNC